MQLHKLFVLVVCLVACSAEVKEEEEEKRHEECAEHYAHLEPDVGDIQAEFRRTKEGYYYHHKKFAPGIFRDITDHKEEGKVLSPGTEKEELFVMGEYSYKVGDFSFFVVYTGDRNGFRPKIIFKKYPCAVIYSPSTKLLQNLSG